MKKKFSTLIISDVPPVSKYTAGQVLKNVNDQLSINGTTHFFWFNQGGLDANIDNIEIVGKGSLRSISRFRKFRILRPIVRILNLFILLYGIFSSANKINKLIKINKYDVVWASIQGSKFIILLWLIRFRQSVTVLQQWDPLSWWQDHRGRSAIIKKISLILLKFIKRKMNILLVPSENWKNTLRDYENVYVLDNWYHFNYDCKPIMAVDRKVKKLVFIGQIYAYEELESLMLRLSDLFGEYELYYYGTGKLPDVQGVKKYNLGYCDPSVLIEEISVYDMALFPYPVHERFSETVLKSFPSKVRAYIAAGLPIVSYCPKNAYVHEFLSQKYTEHYFNILDGRLDRIKFYDFNLVNVIGRVELSRSITDNIFSSQAEFEPVFKKILELNDDN